MVAGEALKIYVHVCGDSGSGVCGCARGFGAFICRFAESRVGAFVVARADLERLGVFTRGLGLTRLRVRARLWVVYV